MRAGEYIGRPVQSFHTGWIKWLDGLIRVQWLLRVLFFISNLLCFKVFDLSITGCLVISSENSKKHLQDNLQLNYIENLDEFVELYILIYIACRSPHRRCTVERQPKVRVTASIKTGYMELYIFTVLFQIWTVNMGMCVT